MPRRLALITARFTTLTALLTGAIWYFTNRTTEYPLLVGGMLAISIAVTLPPRRDMPTSGLAKMVMAAVLMTMFFVVLGLIFKGVSALNDGPGLPPGYV